jgi:aspartyl-tRNA(Asn)/glutamyl-tRNA(Gln) amidotransferase subunit B
MQWEVVIGLEIHTQLATRSKIFSGSATTFGSEPNTQASLIDLGMPGVLPVLNQEAVRMAVMFGLAIDAEIGQHNVFARKNYFYPDLPKGYQISQMELPIVGKGHLDIALEDGTVKRVGITRAHLEEDAGKSLHEDFNGATGIDLNRAGTPLLEIVSEPDMRSAKEAVAYVKAIHALVRYLGICDGNMAEGSLRCDCNVSVRPKARPSSAPAARSRTSTRSASSRRRSTAIQRQIELIEDGGKVIQQTRLYDPNKDETRPCAARRKPTTTVTSRSGPAAGGHRRRSSTTCAPPCRNCRRRNASASRASSVCRPTTPTCWPPAASRRTTSRKSRPSAATPSWRPTG